MRTVRGKKKWVANESGSPPASEPLDHGDQAAASPNERPRVTPEDSPAPSPAVGVQVPQWIRLHGRSTTVLVTGLLIATGAGWSWGVGVSHGAQAAFDKQGAAIASAVSEAIQRDTDLTAMARTVVESNPNLTNAGLSRWLTQLQARVRYPNALGITYTQAVSQADLVQFVTAVTDDPTAAATPNAAALHDNFIITPANASPPYCFTRLLSLNLSASHLASDITVPPGIDWCASSIGGSLSLARDANKFVVAKVFDATSLRLLGIQFTKTGMPAQTAKALVGAVSQLLANAIYIEAPVYLGATAPPTVALRRAVIVGWVSGMFDTDRIVDSAIGNRSGLYVGLTQRNPGSRVTQTIDTNDVPRSAHGLAARYPINLADGRWTVDIVGPRPAGLSSGLVQGALVFVGVMVIVAMVIAMLETLVRSRGRALTLVDERTRELRHLALHDGLTGLPNRVLVLDRLTQMMARTQREHTPCAAFFIDLDNFKDINDSLGHDSGDEVLRVVAQRLASTVRQSDTVGRLGGDEFVVLSEGAELEDGPELIAQRLIRALGEPVTLEASHVSYDISASIGIAAGARQHPEDLLRDADIALYNAKAAGKGRHAMFKDAMEDARISRIQLEQLLRASVGSDCYYVVYQPIFNLATRRTVRLEALLRWRDPDLGDVEPTRLVPLLEDSGLIIDVGAWVLREACRLAAELHQAGQRVSIAVNVSPRQVESDHFVDQVRVVLSECGVNPRDVTLELTESTFIRRRDQAVQTLQALRGEGIRVSLDDFGTEYSTLSYLQDIPVDELKLDRQFVTTIGQGSPSRCVAETLINLGKALGLDAVAEGIETTHQLALLRKLGCELGQGFLYSEPLPSSAVMSFIQAMNSPDSPAGVTLRRQVAEQCKLRWA